MSTLTTEIPERNGNLTVVNPPGLPEERKGLTKKKRRRPSDVVSWLR